MNLVSEIKTPQRALCSRNLKYLKVLKSYQLNFFQLMIRRKLELELCTKYNHGGN